MRLPLILLPLLIAGCSMLPASRVVLITIPQTEAAGSGSDGISASLATKLFRELADHLSLVVKDYSRPFETNLQASSGGRNKYSFYFLALTIKDQRIVFRAVKSGTEREFAVAREAAGRFRKSLDGYGISYEVKEDVVRDWSPP